MKYWQLLLVALGASLFTLGGVGFSVWYQQKSSCHFTYVNRDFVCKKTQSISKTGYIKLENDIREFIDEQKKEGKVDEVSVYFRDLRNGPTFGVEERALFSPASLLKLPLIITLLSLEEDMPELPRDNILFQKEDLAQFDIPPQVEPSGITLQEGKLYSVEELMHNTIVYSDNYSYYTLIAFLNRVIENGTTRILNTFQDLGIIDPRTPSEEVVSVQGYASIFRVLYNASYLSPDASEKLLSWLADSAYTKGLKAGVPQGVRVADKFGERELAEGKKQLHDCGIVFYENNPYTLCVMTRGSEWDELRFVIAQISKKVYAEVDSRRLLTK